MRSSRKENKSQKKNTSKILLIAVISFLAIIWGWYFFVYKDISFGEIPVEKYYWNKDSEKQLMEHLKSYIEYDMFKNSIEFTDYTKRKDYKCSMNDDGIFVFSASTEFKNDEGDLGIVDFKQELACNAVFNPETKLYSLKWKVRSVYKLPKTTEWKEFNAGNGVYSATVTEKELRSRMNLAELIDAKLTDAMVKRISNLNNALGKGAF